MRSSQSVPGDFLQANFLGCTSRCPKHCCVREGLLLLIEVRGLWNEVSMSKQNVLRGRLVWPHPPLTRKASFHRFFRDPHRAPTPRLKFRDYVAFQGRR